MSAGLNSGYLGMPIEETVPDAAMVKGVSRSSLLTGRRRIRLQPQTGTSAGPNSIIQFVLADSSSLLDLNSAVISATVTTTGTGDVAMDDGPAWCRRATIALNGTNIDDTDIANRWANAQVYAGADRSWYNGAGSFANYWASNPSLATSGSTYPPTSYAVGDVSGALVAASVRNKAGTQLAWPVSLMSKFFGTKQYLPLSQAGELVIQLLCDTNANALYQRAGNTDGAYTLTNIFLEVDMIQPHYLYAEMLNRVTQLEGEQGLVVPFDAVISAQGQSITSSGQANIVTSLATNNLRKVVVTFSPINEATINYPLQSTFGNHALTGVQFRVGSLYFPSQEAVNTGSIFWMSQSAFNNGDPVHIRNGVMDLNTYQKTTGAGPVGQNVTCSYFPFTQTTAATLNGQGQKQYYADCCVIAYGFDNAKNTEPLDADGISVLGQAGSQLVSLLRVAPNATFFTQGILPNIHLQRTRYIVLKNGALRVEGV
jgi:hypothetical protein